MWTLESISDHHRSLIMASQYSGVTFNKDLGKWYGQVRPKHEERAGLPETLQFKKTMSTDSHDDEEDAARAVDK